MVVFGMRDIIRSPKLYIDTNHLVELTKLRCGEPLACRRFRDAYALIDDCLVNRHFGVIFSIAASLEWFDGNASLQRALQIGRVLDSAKLIYVMDLDKLVYTGEILRECKRIEPQLHIPEIPAIRVYNPGQVVPHMLHFLLNRVPGYAEDGDVPREYEGQELPEQYLAKSVADYVKSAFAWKQDHPEVYCERIDGYRASLQGDIDAARPNLELTKKERVDWFTRYLKVDRIIAAWNPGVDAAHLVERIALENCPATNLWLTARQYRIRSARQAPKGEGDDWQFLPAVVYGDLILTDRNFRESLLQADRTLAEKIPANPDEVACRMREWM